MAQSAVVPNRMLKYLLLTRPFKKVQMQGGAGYAGTHRRWVGGVLRSYVAASRERAGYPSQRMGAADGPFSAAC